MKLFSVFSLLSLSITVFPVFLLTFIYFSSSWMEAFVSFPFFVRWEFGLSRFCLAEFNFGVRDILLTSSSVGRRLKALSYRHIHDFYPICRLSFCWIVDTSWSCGQFVFLCVLDTEIFWELILSIFILSLRIYEVRNVLLSLVIFYFVPPMG